MGLPPEPACAGHPARVGLFALCVHRLPRGFRAHPQRICGARRRARSRPLATIAACACTCLRDAGGGQPDDRVRASHRRLRGCRAHGHRHRQRRHAQPVAGQPELASGGHRLGGVDRARRCCWWPWPPGRPRRSSARIRFRRPRRPLRASALSGPATLAVVAWCLLCSMPAFWIPELITLRWAWLSLGAHPICCDSRRHAQRRDHVSAPPCWWC